MAYVKKFQIPPHEVDPSTEMIVWLHGLKQEWDGDDSGITICIGRNKNGDQHWVIAAPGDWLIQDDLTGFVAVATEDQVKEMGL